MPSHSAVLLLKQDHQSHDGSEMQYYPPQSASPEIRKKKKNQTKQQRTLQCKKKKKLCKEGNYTTLMNSHKLWQILYTLKGSFFRLHQYPLLTLATFKSIPPLGGGGKGGEQRGGVVLQLLD